MAEYYRNAWYAQLQKKVAELEEEIRKAIELPIVSAADEGKVLTVDSEGKWGAEESVTNINYSLDEQKIGTWVDGKPVYQKVFAFSDITGESYSSPALGLNIKNVVDFFATVKLGADGGGQWITPYFENTSYKCDAHYQSGNDTINISVSGWGLTDAIVTIRYTKTTD